MPLWRLAAVLERGKASGSLSRFHAAYPAARRLHYYFRPNPERQQAVEHLVCSADTAGGEGGEGGEGHAALLVVQTTQYYVPLLASNARLHGHLQRLFLPVDTDAATPPAATAPPAASDPPRPFEADLDVFGPLFRFLLRPSAEVEAAVSTFAATHFANAARVVGLHMRGGIPGADNRWVNAFGRGSASLHAVTPSGGHVALLVKANDKRLKIDVKASDAALADLVVAELGGLAV